MSGRAGLAGAGLRVAYRAVRWLPTRPRVTIISRQSQEPSRDVLALRDALHAAAPDLEVVVLVRMLRGGWLNQLTYAAHLLRQMVAVARSRVLVVDTYSIVASVLDHKDSLTIVQMWHALGAFKKFGLAATGTPLGPSVELARSMRMHANYDWVLASGPACVPAYAQAFGVRPEQVVVAPLPRVDDLVDPHRVARTRAEVLARHPDLTGERIVLFAPTFRRGADTTPMDAVAPSKADATTAREPAEADRYGAVELAAALAERGRLLVVKEHPLDPTPWPAGLRTVDDVPTQDLLTVSEALVTDYSSMVYEAAILGLPIFRYIPAGLPELADDDFFLDLARDLPAPSRRDPRELAAAIEGSSDDPAAREAFLAAYVTVPATGTCAAQVADLVAGWAAPR